MKKPTPPSYNKRESELMDAIHLRGSSSAVEIESNLANPPSNAAIRTTLRILVQKGHLRYEKKGRSFIYHPVVNRQEAGQKILKKTIATFFDGSLTQAIAGFIDRKDQIPSLEELEQLNALITKAQQKNLKDQ